MKGNLKKSGKIDFAVVFESAILTVVSLLLSVYSAYGIVLAFSFLLFVSNKRVNFIIISLIAVINSIVYINRIEIVANLILLGVFLAFIIILKMTSHIQYLFEVIGVLFLGIAYFLVLKLELMFGIAVCLQAVFLGLVSAFSYEGVEKFLSGETVMHYMVISFYLLTYFLLASVINVTFLSGSLIFLILPILLMCLISLRLFDQSFLIVAVCLFVSHFVSKDSTGLIFLIFAISSLIFYQFNSLLFAFVQVGALAVSFFCLNFALKSYLPNFILSSLSVLSFCFIPKAVFENHKIIKKAKEEILSKVIINDGRKHSSDKIFELQSVYGNLSQSFVGLKNNLADSNYVAQECKKEVVEVVCQKCPKKSKCYDENTESVEEDFVAMAKAGMARGNSNLLDLSKFLTQNCVNVNNLISVVNEKISNAQDYNNKVTYLNDCKEVLAKQFKGVESSLNSLQSELSREIEFDENLQRKVKQSLALYNVNILELFCYKEEGLPRVVLTIKAKERPGKRLVKGVSEGVGMKMVGEKSLKTERRGVLSIRFNPSPRIDMVFGVGAIKKRSSNISGDIHSINRLKDFSIALTLSDGMGSGEGARNVSERAISLVENLYKANFDINTIVSTVNNLLSLSQGETFAAMDMCFVNLAKETLDIIKLGSPPTFILSKEVTEISGKALPLGILDKVEPTKISIKINRGDFVILVSDGVYDVMAPVMSLFLTKKKYYNPQTLADDILEKAKELVYGQGKEDDMSVVVAKVVDRVS